MLHYIQNKSINLFMIISFTLLFGALGYLYYKSKEEITLVEKNDLEIREKTPDDDDLYEDLEDLFI